MSVNCAVVYYSSTGNVHEMATAVAEGAAEAGADVRLRRVAELAPESAIAQNEAWARHHAETRDLPIATLEDLEWADAVVFGTPTRFGNVASQLKQFLDMAGPLWAQGKLAGKVASGFVSVATGHGGHESTLLALYNTLYHWGAVIVPPGYTDPVVDAAGGNPYGTSHRSGDGAPGPEVLEACRYQGRRCVEFARVLKRERVPALA